MAIEKASVDSNLIIDVQKYNAALNAESQENWAFGGQAGQDT